MAPHSEGPICLGSLWLGEGFAGCDLSRDPGKLSGGIIGASGAMPPCGGGLLFSRWCAHSGRRGGVSWHGGRLVVASSGRTHGCQAVVEQRHNDAVREGFIAVSGCCLGGVLAQAGAIDAVDGHLVLGDEVADY